MHALDTLARERLAIRERMNAERYKQECEEEAKMQMRPLIEERAKMLMAQVISDHMECDSLRQASIHKIEEEREFTWGDIAYTAGFMNTGQFRNKREDAPVPLYKGQHVGHILSRKYGGADHEDNYFILGDSLNMSLGSENNHVMAEMAGLEQTKKAVAVSRRTGYTGPGAEELIEMAKAARAEAKAARTAAPRPAVRRPARNVRVPTKHVKVRLAKKEYSLCI